MDTSKIIRGVVSNGRYTVTAPIVKEDYGLYLQIEGVELPQTYEVDFSNSEHSGTSVTMIGNSDGVLIPHQFIDTGKDIFAFLYHVGANYGRTVYKFRIPNKVRPDRTNEEPTPEEQSLIDQTISALNTAVTKTAQDVISADQSARSASDNADRAESAMDTAGEYANDAQNSAESASESARVATEKATASAESASASAQIKADVEGMVDDAQSYAESALIASQASVTARDTAQGYANSASASAQSASGYASNAQTSANTASSKATEASTSAQTASTKATESAQSALQALSYKTDAEQAKTASQTAQGLAESARDSAISAKNDAESAKTDAESARDEAQSIVDGISGALDDKADIITDTASGSIASFSDGADNLPLKSLVVDINPIQDLHGQDAPYPAGGGVNKFKYNASVGTQIINGVTWTLYEDGSIQVSGTASGASTFRYVLPKRVEDDDFYFSGNYKFYAFPANISTADFQGGVKIGSKWYSVYADGYSSALNDADGKIVEAWFQVRVDKTVNATIRPMIYPESESTPTAWSPYENLCPISGWTEVDVVRCGKNLIEGYFPLTLSLLNNVVYLGGINGNTEGTTIYFPCKKGVTYVRSHLPNDSSNRSYWGAFDHFPEPKDSTADIQNAGLTFTPSVDGYCCIYIKNAADAELINFWQVEVGTTATEYEAPKTNLHIPISWQTEAGTVYGGKLDVLSGELVVDRAMVDLGTLNWNRSDNNGVWSHYLFYTNIQTQTLQKNYVCSAYPIASLVNITQSPTDKAIYGLKTNTYIYIRDDDYATATDFKSAVTGQTLVYELAEPIEIQLSPNQVNSLLGVNNLWADSGDTEVVYRADTKLYIERLTAPDSADMIADANITSGKYFMVGNDLYKATVNIASGAQIVVGTNATKVSLSEALNEINA